MPLSNAKPLVRWGLVHALPLRAMKVAARRGDLQSRLAVESQSRPTAELLPLFAQIRAAGPVAPSRYARVTVDHAAVKEVLTGPDFRVGFDADDHQAITRVIDWSGRTGLHPIEPPSMLATEPPDHTRYRRLVTKVFTARAVERLRARTEQIAAELLDDIDHSGQVDLVEAYCSRLPVAVIAEILGVPEKDRPLVLRLGEAAAGSLDMGLSWHEFRRVEGALQDFDLWLDEHIETLRRSPGDDLFSQLIAASDENQQLDHRELKATAGLVLAAGFETTVNLLGNAMQLLSDHPDQLALLRAEPDLWPNAVEEVLRVDPPVMLTSRSATREVEVAGRAIPQGGLVVTVLAGANRDPQVFDDPDRFDVRRENAREHLSFSAGRHFCVGAALARMESEVALRAFYDRFSQVEMLPGARRRSTRVLQGYATLPARLTPVGAQVVT